MPDREKVIKALQEIVDDKWMKNHADWYVSVCADALVLLKEQEKTKVVFGRTKDGEFFTECGNCGTHLDKAYSNCPKCKKELDWNSNQT